jgi:hypothetical protein
MSSLFALTDNSFHSVRDAQVDCNQRLFFNSLIITCHPQGELMFLAKITGKQFVKHEHILCEGCGSI